MIFPFVVRNVNGFDSELRLLWNRNNWRPIGTEINYLPPVESVRGFVDNPSGSLPQLSLFEDYLRIKAQYLGTLP